MNASKKGCILQFALCVVSLVIGVLFGATGSRGDKPVAEMAPRTGGEQIADVGDKASIAALRARISELERQLAERGVPSAEAKAEQPVAEEVADAGRGRREPRRNMREEMERLKTEEPERYAQITNQMARFRRRRSNQAKSRLEFLASVDTSRMSKGAKETHEQLQGLLSAREDLETKMMDPNLSDDERGELFQQMVETEFRIRRLSRAERDNLLGQVAESLGYAGDEAAEISGTISGIMEATEDDMGRFGPPPDGPHDGPRGDRPFGGSGRRGGRGAGGAPAGAR